MKVKGKNVPTWGDFESAFKRLLDCPSRVVTVRLSDALVIRDWCSEMLFIGRCLHASRSGPFAMTCDIESLGWLLDSRTTQAIMEDQKCTEAQIDGP